MGASDTDDVFPLHFLDDIGINRIVVNWLVHFNDALDAQKLHDSLLRLLQIGDWKRAGGRLRQRNGKLEIHVPQQFSSSRPAFLYHHDSIDKSVHEHPLAVDFAAGLSTSRCATYPISNKLKTFMVGPSTPSDFKSWIDKDVPMLSIKVTTFRDATLLGISWPHSLMDASGVVGLLQGWSLVLAGKEDELPPVLGVRNDVLSDALLEARQAKKEVFRVQTWHLKTLGILVWVWRYVSDLLWNGAPEVRRILLTRAALQHLKARAMKESGQDSFISDNSVLTAWFARIVLLTGRFSRPATLISFLNARYRLQQVQQTGVYILNMIVPSFTFLPKGVTDLGQLALEQQRQLDQRASEPQTLGMVAMLHDCYHAGKNPFLQLVVGDKDAVPIGFNNLARLDIAGAARFGPAVVTQGVSKEVQDRQNEPGTASNFTVHVEPERGAYFLTVAGKDKAKNYWMIGRLNQKGWTKLEDELKQLA